MHWRFKCLAQGHNATQLVELKTVIQLSRASHSTKLRCSLVLYRVMHNLIHMFKVSVLGLCTSRNFCQGGPGQSSFFLVLSLFYRSQMVNFIIFQGSRGGPTFSRGGGGGGVQLFPGGFPIETHITCDFPGGGGVSGPLFPLWIRTC